MHLRKMAAWLFFLFLIQKILIGCVCGKGFKQIGDECNMASFMPYAKIGGASFDPICAVFLRCFLSESPLFACFFSSDIEPESGVLTEVERCKKVVFWKKKIAHLGSENALKKRLHFCIDLHFLALHF